MKLGRNDPCWCGSGHKFKVCHLGRETEVPPTREESLKAFYKLQAAQRYCLHPEADVAHCRGGIVRAHSVQGAALRSIAPRGKVLSFQFGRMGTLIRMPDACARQRSALMRHRHSPGSVWDTTTRHLPRSRRRLSLFRTPIVFYSPIARFVVVGMRSGLRETLFLIARFDAVAEKFAIPPSKAA